MQGKDTFVLRIKYIHQIEKLSDEEAGQFFKHLMRYVNDLNPEPPSRLIEVSFEPIKQDLKEDLSKWLKKLKTQSHSGLIGNLKRWHPDIYSQFKKGEITIKEALELSDLSHTDNSIANVGDNDCDSDSDNDCDNVNNTHVLFYRELKSNKNLKITIEEMNRLLKKYPKEVIDLMLDKIDNYKSNKKYNSLNLTVQTWLRKEFPDGYQKNSTGKKTAVDKLNELLTPNDQ